MCEYGFRNGKKCQEPAIEGSQLCVLHTPFPENTEGEEYQQLQELKLARAQEKVNADDFNFEGVRFDSFKIPFSTSGDVNFEYVCLSGDADFDGAKIGGGVRFTGAKIGGDVRFTGAEINKGAWFDQAKIGGDAWFDWMKIGGNASFSEVKIGGLACFTGSEISGPALFTGVDINKGALFDQAKIGGDARFDRMKIGGNAKFAGAEIDGNAKFTGTNIDGDAWFTGAKLGRIASFAGVKIGGNAEFDRVKIVGGVEFEQAEIGGNAKFRQAKIGEHAGFDRVKIGGNARFIGANINGNAEFENSLFSGDIEIIPIYVKGQVNFKDTKFKSPKAQEYACRIAKNQCIKFGDNHEADHYFYREMEGKRKQKLEMLSWPELIFVQWIFGYGVKPFRTLLAWFGVISLFAGTYYFFHTLDSTSNITEYLYFSTITAMTPGFGGDLISPEWQGLALIEAFFGTFMWAAFITIFARKYMR